MPREDPFSSLSGTMMKDDSIKIYKYKGFVKGAFKYCEGLNFWKDFLW